MKKTDFKNFATLQENTFVECLFNKVAGLKDWSFI